MYACIKIKLVFSQEIHRSSLAEKFITWANTRKLLTRKNIEIVPEKEQVSKLEQQQAIHCIRIKKMTETKKNKTKPFPEAIVFTTIVLIKCTNVITS